MKLNIYDNEVVFNKYSAMDRSVKGLSGAGEWHELEKMLPDFSGKRVLDLGCGFGWHCAYAAEHGAVRAVGVDCSEKMLAQARSRNSAPQIEYLQKRIEEAAFEPDTFDVVLSSLALHYVESFADVCKNVAQCLTENGDFVFSVEHPVFTAYGNQDWIYDKDGHIDHWPVDRYFTEGEREAIFLGEPVRKYHKTLTTYVSTLLACGFTLTGIVEPQPDPAMLDTVPGMRDELRRPMMLLVSAKKR